MSDIYQLLNTSKSATFYRASRPLTRKFIENLFKALSTERIGRVLAKTIKDKRAEPRALEISLLVYRYEDKPSFLRECEHKESKLAFLMLIESAGHVAMLKRNISRADAEVLKKVERQDYELIQHLFSSENPQYEKIATSNISLSKTSISKRTLQSSDLRGLLPAQTLRRSIPTFTTIKTQNHRHTLRPSRSSISKSDSKSDLDGILVWLHEIFTELESPIVESVFLKNFAQPVDFSSVEEIPLSPNLLVLDTSELKELLENGATLKFNDKVIQNRKLARLLDLLDSTFQLEEVAENINIKYLDMPWKANLGFMKINSKSFSLKSIWLRRITLEQPGEKDINLEQYFSAKQNFMVTFDKPEFAYIERRIVQDRGLITHCDEIINCMVSTQFGQIDSEKGTYNDQSTDFEIGSVFSYVETVYAHQNSIIICDDLGDEWADYLVMDSNPAEIKLIHCKHGKSSTSASQLHDIVSQALKNTGRLTFTRQDIENKLRKWRQTYAETSSNIQRVRSGHSDNEILEAAEQIIKAAKVSKEIQLVTPFLSKAAIEIEFQKLKNGEETRPHINQLIWLLSSFILACKETGALPVVFTKP